MNPPARFSTLKSAKSGGGKSASSSSILSRLPRAIAKQLSRRTASVGGGGKNASSGDLPGTAPIVISNDRRSYSPAADERGAPSMSSASMDQRASSKHIEAKAGANEAAKGNRDAELLALLDSIGRVESRPLATPEAIAETDACLDAEADTLMQALAAYGSSGNVNRSEGNGVSQSPKALTSEQHAAIDALLSSLPNSPKVPVEQYMAELERFARDGT